MKKTVQIMTLALIILSMVATSVFADEPIGSQAVEEDTIYTLDEMLAYALQDELMAQAEYEAIMETFDVEKPFSNIYQAELTHEAALMTLYESRNLEVPTFDPEAYVVLPSSIEMIYSLGIEAEIKNIAMYDVFLAQDLDDDVRLVFENLQSASEKHLAAFERAASGSRGGRYGKNRRR